MGRRTSSAELPISLFRIPSNGSDTEDAGEWRIQGDRPCCTLQASMMKRARVTVAQAVQHLCGPSVISLVGTGTPAPALAACANPQDHYRPHQPSPVPSPPPLPPQTPPTLPIRPHPIRHAVSDSPSYRTVTVIEWETLLTEQWHTALLENSRCAGNTPTV